MRAVVLGLWVATCGCGAIVGIDGDDDTSSSSSSGDGSSSTSSSGGSSGSSSGGSSSSSSTSGSTSSGGHSSSGSSGLQSFDSTWSTTELGAGAIGFAAWAVGGHVFVASDQAFHHRDPQQAWTDEPLPDGFVPQGLWGRTASDVWAVGAGSPILAHRDGAGWSAVSPGLTLPAGARLNGVSGLADGTLYAVGEGGLILHRHPSGAWNKENNSRTDRLQSVWLAAANELYAANYDGLVLHSNGNGNWSVERDAVQSVNAVRSGRNLWGNSTTNLYLSTEQQGLLHSTGDGDWQPALGAENVHPISLAGFADGSLLVSGVGVLYRYEAAPQRWRQTEVVDRQTALYDVCAVSANEVYVIDSDATLYSSTSSIRE